ncbi:MAG TPA: hypothetical protein PLQ38_05385 [Methanothrix sp.]|nr:hypothetical protein [Methanothrix sp.]
MNRIALALLSLIAVLILAQCKPMVDLGGRDGRDLFGSLTNNSTGNSSLNLSEENQSLESSFLNLSENGGSLLKNLANSSENLSSWGGPLPKAPLPPKYDASAASYAKTYAILKANHGF